MFTGLGAVPEREEQTQCRAGSSGYSGQATKESGFPVPCLPVLYHASAGQDPLATAVENVSLNFLTSVYLNTP